MVVDKPFIFALRDRRPGSVLLNGYVGNVKNGTQEMNGNRDQSGCGLVGLIQCSPRHEAKINSDR